eukprot:jgi/Mesen1/3031/ME000179S02145
MVTRPSFSLIVVCVILMAVHSISGVRIQEADHTALLNLRKGFQNQSALQSWDYMECDNIKGVECFATGHVSSLALSRNQFSGPIPGCFQDLAALQSLYVSSNRLSGPLPAELCLMKNLRYL